MLIAGWVPCRTLRAAFSLRERASSSPHRPQHGFGSAPPGERFGRRDSGVVGGQRTHFSGHPFFLCFFRLASKDQLGVDHGESFKHCHVTKSLIGAYEMIDRGDATCAERNRKLNCVEGTKPKK
jgi:hypothetical protein